MNWCINDRTALAEAEVEYENHTSPSIWVRFALTSDPAAIDPALAGRKVYGLIWTTTPWTIPANMAIAFHPKFEYVAVEVAGDVYIVADGSAAGDRRDAAAGRSRQVVATFAGAKLEGAVFRHPFLERDSLGILADHVTLEQGTGAVHTAPGMARKTTSSAGSTASTRTARWMRPGGSSMPKAPTGQLARRADRQDGLGGEPDRHRAAEAARRAAGAAEDRAQLSALLALPQADHLPRHRAVVHRHGPQRPARRARSKPSAA